jgi:RNA polymerase sigma-70 factor (ECF subfamily)
VELARWDESLLVRRCQEGSEAAFAELVRRHRPRLYTLAFRLTANREAAEDVVQETFVAAFRAIDRFEPRPSLAAWLNTILLRLAGRAAGRLDKQSKASLESLGDEDEISYRLADAAGAAANDPHAAAEAAELRRTVSSAISALPFNYRAAVVTRFVMGMEYAEAAASLEIGLNTYKSNLLRGTKLLREALAPVVGRARPAAAAVPALIPEPPVAVAPIIAPAPTATFAGVSRASSARHGEMAGGLTSPARTSTR